MIIIYILPLTTSTFSDIDEKLSSYITSSRQPKMQKFYQNVDKKLCLYADLLTRTAISSLLNIPYKEIHIQYPYNQKPYVKNIPDIKFNFSHTKNCILLCISNTSDVGADIERIDNYIPEIVRSSFSYEEQDSLTERSKKSQAEQFYRIWTKKESYLKKIGCGLVNNLASINTFQLPTNFYSLKYQKYICTICYDTISPIQIKYFTEQQLAHTIISPPTLIL